MRLVWVVIPLVLIGIIGIQNVESQVPASYYYSELTIDKPPKLGETSVLTLEVFAVGGNTDDFPDYRTTIQLPEGFELVSGELVQTNLWKAGGPLTIQVTIKSVQTGNWTIYGLAISATGDALYITVSEDNAYLTEYKISSYISPKKQLEFGVASEDVICKDGLELIFKHDNSPACVKSETAEKLIQRGWTLDVSYVNKCNSIGGEWNYEFDNCVGKMMPTIASCENMGGNMSCMSKEQYPTLTDICISVCEFE